jgi:hypothetical protein
MPTSRDSRAGERCVVIGHCEQTHSSSDAPTAADVRERSCTLGASRSSQPPPSGEQRMKAVHMSDSDVAQKALNEMGIKSAQGLAPFARVAELCLRRFRLFVDERQSFELHEQFQLTSSSKFNCN